MKRITLLLKLSLTLLLTAFCNFTHAQPVVTGSIGTINRPTPKFGFNGTANVAPKPSMGIIGANWTQQQFIDSVAVLYPEIIRFPGGTNANHWDWQTGWFRPGYPSGIPLTLRANEFKPALNACSAEGLFVVNIETSNVNYEMDGLRYTDSLGLNPGLFELGNEHNLDGDTTFPLQLMTPTFYSQLAKTYYDSIKVQFPLAKICVVGGNTGGAPHWHDTLLQYIPAIDAFAFHVYLTANNADLAFNVNRALAIPFGSITNNKTLAYRYNKAGFDSLPINKEVWVTEYNLQENQIASTPVIAGTWTHLLYNTAFNNFLLSQANITMIINHAIAGGATYYESISKLDNHITANGVSVKLLSDVARGSSTCQNLNFSGSPSMTYGSATIPKLIGWKFNHVGSEKGFICNFSVDTFKLSLSSVFANAMQFDQFYADTNFVVNGLSSVNKYSGSSTDSIVIYPFSITQINTSITTGIQIQQTTNNNGLWIYPNPSQNDITIQTHLTLTDAEVVIYNIAGQEMKRISNVSGQQIKVATGGLLRGTYFITIKNDSQLVNGKFIVD